jgi:hypothetical protein
MLCCRLLRLTVRRSLIWPIRLTGRRSWLGVGLRLSRILLEEFLAELGPVDEDGKVRPAADLLERVARRAERMRARLGLDPLSRASLAKDLAVARSGHDLERLKALGQALLDAADGDTAEACAGDHYGDGGEGEP